MKVVGLIQARMGSKRLPGKVIRKINGLPLIWHIYRRLLRCKSLSDVVVSAGNDERQLPLMELCRSKSMKYHFGSLDDLLGRHLESGAAFYADAVLRITSDCLFHDPDIIDEQVDQFKFYWPRERGRSEWPHRIRSEGLDSEIWSMELLSELDLTPNCPREGFAAWVCEDQARALKYKVTLCLQHPVNEGEPHLSIDTEEDVAQAEAMLKLLGNNEFRYEKTMEAYADVHARREV